MNFNPPPNKKRMARVIDIAGSDEDITEEMEEAGEEILLVNSGFTAHLDIDSADARRVAREVFVAMREAADPASGSWGNGYLRRVAS